MELFPATRLSCWKEVALWPVIEGHLELGSVSCKEMYKHVFCTQSGFQGLYLPPRFHGYSVQQSGSPLRKDCLGMYIQRTGVGQKAIVLFVVSVQVLLQCLSFFHSASSSSSSVLAYEVMVSAPGRRSLPSSAPPHSQSGTESYCFLGKTCLPHKTCTNRERREVVFNQALKARAPLPIPMCRQGVHLQETQLQATCQYTN